MGIIQNFRKVLRRTLPWFFLCPLSYAALRGRISVIRVLAAAKERLNDLDSDGFAPIHYAIWNPQTDSIVPLVSLGANVDLINGFGNSPLHMAAYLDLNQHAKILLEQGADLALASSESLGFQAIHYCCFFGSPKTAKVLLERGQNPETICKDGITPLHACLMANILIEQRTDGRIEVAKMLINSGADIKATTDYGTSVIHMAVISPDQVPILELLLKRGVPKNVRNTNGDTALHIAAFWGNVKGVEVLLQAGLNPEEKNSQGLTAADIAKKENRKNISALLLQSHPT